MGCWCSRQHHDGCAKHATPHCWFSSRQTRNEKPNSNVFIRDGKKKVINMLVQLYIYESILLFLRQPISITTQPDYPKITAIIKRQKENAYVFVFLGRTVLRSQTLQVARVLKSLFARSREAVSSSRSGGLIHRGLRAFLNASKPPGGRAYFPRKLWETELSGI